MTNETTDNSSKVWRSGSIILLLIALSGCASTPYTSVRQHPEFQATRTSFEKVVLFPPDVTFEHMVFNGDNQRVADTEKLLAERLVNMTPKALVDRGYEVSPFTFEQPAQEGSDFAFEMEQLRDAYGRASIDLYDQALIKVTESRNFRKSVGTVVNQFCELADADAMLVTRFYGFDKSGGVMAKEIIAAALFGALTGSVPMYPPKGSAVEVALLNCTSGDVLWSNVKSDGTGTAAVLKLALDELPKR